MWPFFPFHSISYCLSDRCRSTHRLFEADQMVAAVPPPDLYPLRSWQTQLHNQITFRLNMVRQVEPDNPSLFCLNLSQSFVVHVQVVCCWCEQKKIECNSLKADNVHIFKRETNKQHKFQIPFNRRRRIGTPPVYLFLSSRWQKKRIFRIKSVFSTFYRIFTLIPLDNGHEMSYISHSL